MTSDPGGPDASSWSPTRAQPSGPTLPARWSASWAGNPGAPALVADGRTCSGGELDERTRQAAARFAAAGLAAGDRVVWSSRPSLEGVVACLGALRLGLTVVPANPALTESELAHMVADIRPAGAVVDGAAHARWLEGAGPPVVVLAVDLGAERVPRGRGPAPERLDHSDAAAPALVVYTSGTTGAPKGAVLTHGNLAAGAAALEEAWCLVPADRLVLSLPLFHVHGLCAGLFTMLAVGASAELFGRFDAVSVLEAARRDATVFFGVPTMYHRLAGEAGVAALSALRLCVSGSAALAPALWHRLAARARISVLERYGMTETLLTLSNPYEGERRPGTVGFALPGVEVRLDPDGDGELYVSGPSVFAGYWERPAATAEAFVGPWFRTGDAARRDGDGYYAIRGRRGDLIISGGFNVYPAEVEDVLLSHAAVSEAAVSGTESEEWGQEVTAWIVAGDAVSAGEILAFAADRLAPYKRPRHVHFVDALPKNAMGKVERSRLR